MKTKFKVGVEKIADAFHNYQPHIIMIVCFTCSAIFSISLYETQGYSDFSKRVFSALAIAVDMGKFCFPVLAITYFRRGGWKNVFGSFGFIVLGLGCFAYSIAASMGYNLIEIQKLKHDAYKTSSAYIAQQSYEINKQKTIEQLENDIKKLESDRASEVKALEKIRDDWDPAKYSDGKIYRREKMQEAQNKIIDTTKDWNDKISPLKSKLNELRIEKGQVFENKTDEEFGYSILFGNKENEKYFFLGLSVLIELIGIASAIEISNRRKRNAHNMPKTNNVVSSPSPLALNLSAFGSDDDSSYTDEDVEAYKKCVMENLKDGNISPGYRFIAETLGYKMEKARKIKGHLEQSNWLKSEGNKTYVL